MANILKNIAKIFKVVGEPELSCAAFEKLKLYKHFEKLIV
jgi:hypothetical protein